MTHTYTHHNEDWSIKDKFKSSKTNYHSTEYVQGRQRKKLTKLCTELQKLKGGVTLTQKKKKERKKHANVEYPNSLQFAIGNLQSFTLMTLQKDNEKLKNIANLENHHSSMTIY